MKRTKHFAPFGIKIYRNKLHLAIALSLVILPFLFVAFVLPLSAADKQLFLYELIMSFLRLLAAYIISAVLALALAILFSRGKIGNIFLPIFDVLQSFPTFAMLPLAVYWLGPGNITVILFLVITIIWPMLFAIISSQKIIREDWEEAATIYGATGWKRLIYFALPISYPGFITGSIVGLGEGWEALVGSEIIVGLNGGLGEFFNSNGTNGRIVIFGVLALLLFIFALNKLLWLPLLEKSHKSLTE